MLLFIGSDVLHTPFVVFASKGSEKPLLCLSPSHGKKSCVYEWEVRTDNCWKPLLQNTCVIYGRAPGEYRCSIRCEKHSELLPDSPFLFTLKRKVL